MPQMSMDCLGLLSLSRGHLLGEIIKETLARHYLKSRHPIAFVDESYDVRARASFYVVAVAIVNVEDLHASRAALAEFYGGRAFHAAPMYARREMETLRQATRLVALQNDGLDVIVCAPIHESQSKDQARRVCLSVAAKKVQTDFGTQLFVLDSLGTPTENGLDQHTFSDLRASSAEGLHRDTVAVHCRPSDEILLGLPDVLAWSYRQEYARNDPSWFEPMRGVTHVTVLEGQKGEMLEVGRV